MENNEFNYPQNLSNIAFDRFCDMPVPLYETESTRHSRTRWEQFDGQLLTKGVQPTQAAPFFQILADERQQPLPADSSSKFDYPPPQIHFQPSTSSYQERGFNEARRRRSRQPQGSRVKGSGKRQKITHTPSSSYEPQGSQEALDMRDDGSVGDGESECCSSCSDGIPCASPDCAPCSEPGCDMKTIEVIPCNKKACEQPACTDQCLSAGIRIQQTMLNKATLPCERAMSNLIEQPWHAQISRNSPQMRQESLSGIMDPKLKAFESYVSASASPAPTTPTLGNNIQTPYSPNTGLITAPQIPCFPQAVQSTSSGAILSGTGAIFNSMPQQWPEQIFSQENDPQNSVFECTWDGCFQPFTSYEDWLPHLHKDHVDPQLVFGCPIQAENCPETISSNPLDHLQMDHGFNFDLNENNFSCPAPDCFPSETFCDPAMLHNHFDHVHATPAQGGFRCRLEGSCDFFGDYNGLFSHINEQHPLPPSSIKDDDIDLMLPSAPATTGGRTGQNTNEDAAVDKDQLPSSSEVVHSCLWKENDRICGLVCQSDVELQTHIKHAHLDFLDRISGYKCLWDDCKRQKEMPPDKQGFSQRGKLERHMQTHTNFKCSVCDVCGQKFSAPQSMKQHRLLHTGEKPWKCKYCGKAFPQQSACTIHERTHTNEKPLECSICGKKFSESSNLSKHRKIHGERGLHVCSFEGCGKSFHRLDQLKRHGLTHERKRAKASPSEAGSTLTKTEAEED